jgi:fibronectin-binding autotransporter adhesin
MLSTRAFVVLCVISFLVAFLLALTQSAHASSLELSLAEQSGQPGFWVDGSAQATSSSTLPALLPKLNLSENKIDITARLPDAAEAKHSLPAQYKGRDLSTGYSPQFLMTTDPFAPSTTLRWAGTGNASAPVTRRNWTSGAVPESRDVTMFSSTAGSMTLGIDMSGATNERTANEIVDEVALTGGENTTIQNSSSTTAETLTLADVSGVLLPNSSTQATRSTTSTTSPMPLPPSAPTANSEKDVLTTASSDLSSAANYFGGTLPNSTNDVAFTASVYNTTAFVVNAALSIGTLNDLDATQALTITGNLNGGTTITLSGGGDTVAGSASGDLIFLAANASLTLLNGNGTKSLGLVLASDATHTNFDIASGATLTIGASSGGGVISGANQSINKTGAGTLTLWGANTFGGSAGNNFTLSAGTVNINNASALGNVANTFIINGGTIDNTSNGSIATSNYPLTINGNFTFTGTQSLDLGTGATTLGTAAGTTRTITVNANTLTIGGAISNGTTANSLTKLGAGTLALGGSTANTYSGLTTVSAGTLNLGKTASGVNAFGGDLTINGGAVAYSSTGDNQIPDAAKVTITSGTYTLSAGRTETIGTTSTAASGLVMSGGTISIASAQTLTLANSINITGGTISFTANGTVQASTELNFTGGTISFGSTSGALNLRGGTGTGITYSSTGTTGSSITGSGSVSLNTSGTTIFTINDAASVATELTISSAIVGNSTVQKNGSGVLQYAGTAANTYNGLTTINAGELDLNKTAGTNAIAGNLTIGDGAGTDIVKLLASDQITNTSALTVSGGTFDLQSFNETVGAVTLTSGSIVSTTGTLTGSSYAVESGTVSAILGGTAALTKSTAGTVILSGNNTYSGTTTISGGTLQIGNGGTSGTLGSGAVIDNATLSLNRSDTVTVSGDISGTGVLNKNGAGTAILTGSNSYSGTTTISSGILQIGNGGTSGTLGSGGVTDNAALAFNRSDDGLSVSNLISGTGSVTQAGSGTTTLTANNTYTGATNVNAGKLLINGNQSSASGAVTVTNSGSVLGGTGTIGSAVTVNSGAAILGGTGTSASGTLSVSASLTLNSGSIVELALGPSFTHSTLSRTGTGPRTWTFQSNQQFTFIDLGATSGTYDNIITGLSGSLTTSGWTITNPGWVGTFTFDSGNVDLNLTAVPEPSTWAAASLALIALLIHQRRRIKCSIKH